VRESRAVSRPGELRSRRHRRAASSLRAHQRRIETVIERLQLAGVQVSVLRGHRRDRLVALAVDEALGGDAFVRSAQFLSVARNPLHELQKERLLVALLAASGGRGSTAERLAVQARETDRAAMYPASRRDCACSTSITACPLRLNARERLSPASPAPETRTCTDRSSSSGHEQPPCRSRGPWHSFRGVARPNVRAWRSGRRRPSRAALGETAVAPRSCPGESRGVRAGPQGGRRRLGSRLRRGSPARPEDMPHARSSRGVRGQRR
jgi:hypothetical protein